MKRSMNNFKNCILPFALVFVMLFSFFMQVMPLKVSAATLSYETFDEIKEDLNVFKTIRDGKISVVEKKDKYYYQFKRSGYDTIHINAKAFCTPTKNAYLAEDNKVLTKWVNAGVNEDRICYFTRVTKNDTGGGYGIIFCRFLLEAQGRRESEIVLKCKLTHAVAFLHRSEVYMNPIQLKRFTGNGLFDITPVITVEITDPGDNDVCLSNYDICGTGNASTNENLNSYVKIGKAVWNTVKSKDVISAMFALTELVGTSKTTFTKNSKQYNSGEMLMLSKGKTRVLKAQYTSPIKLTKTGDWVQIKTYFDKSRVSQKKSGQDAMLKVSFSF